jgi:hypothetical protein
VRLRRPTVREMAGAIGSVALALGVVAAFAPDLLPSSMTAFAADVERQVDVWVVVLALSVLVFLYALYLFWRADDGTVERLTGGGDGVVSVPDLDLDDVDFDPDRPGSAFDYAMARTVAQLERDPNADAWEADRIREDLEATVFAVRVGDGRDRNTVSSELADGTWTDDRVAASFLGGPDAPGVSLWRRLYAWLYPARAFERNVERVVAAVERQGGFDPADGHATSGAGNETDRSADGENADASADGDGVAA